MVYQLIWFLLHICTTIVQHLRLTFQRLQVSRSYDSCSSEHEEKRDEEEYNYLDNCRTKLVKLPRHLSLIIGPEEQIKDEVIAQVLRYALRMDIECVSFYDTRSNESQRIQLHNLQRPKGVFSQQLGTRHVLWTTASVPHMANGKPNDTISNVYTKINGVNRKNGEKNGLKDKKSLEIYEVKSSDGRALISDVCRSIFKQRQNQEIKDLLQSRTLLSQHIDKELSMKLWNSTDPELCIVFSKYMCTYGMLPWHTRFTEFYLHQREDIFDEKTFAKILFQYSRCEQRWGK